MVIGRRSLLLAGAALPAVAASARAQCVTDTPSVDACLGGVRITQPPGVTLDLSFFGPTLDPRITFTRASTATYFNSSGTMQTAATNAPRFDYDPVTHAMRGLLIEEARTNTALHSADLSTGWSPSNVGVTPNQAVAPDGSTTAATLSMAAASGAGAFAMLGQGFTATAAVYTYSVWLRGLVGGEQLYLCATPDGATYYRTLRITLSTSWQRYTLTTGTLTATTWYFEIGTDLRDASQASTPAQSVYVWGAQIELGTFPTSYIPTAAAAATRAADSAILTDAVTFGGTGGKTIALEAYAIQNPASGINNNWLDVTDGTAANFLRFFNPQAANIIRTQITVGSVAVGPTGGTSDAVPPVRPTAFKIAAANSSVWNVAIGGVMQANSGGASTQLGPLTTMNIGVGGVAPIGGNIRRVRYWPRALSAAELQQVTR